MFTTDRASIPPDSDGFRNETGVVAPLVHCLSERLEDRRYTVVRLVGVLDPPAVETVRRALLTCLADRPAPVAVDVSRLRITVPGVRSVFDAVHREAAEWLAGPFVLCTSPVDPPETWADAELTISVGRPGTTQLTAVTPTAPQLTASLRPTLGAARQARDLVADGCARWDLATLAGSASIAVTELVGNVVTHAGTPMTIRLGPRDGALHLAVRDFSARDPIFRSPVSPTSVGGRGLLLIDAVARRWGTSRLDDGKVVWAVIHPEDEPAE